MSKDSFKPPQDVANAAKRGLEKREKQAPSDKCCTPTGLARARDLMNRAGVSKDTIKRMNSFFARHGAGTSKEGLDDPNSKASQAWDIWGGDPGKKWADGIKKDLERKGEYLSGSPESYADDAGRWITIGSWKGEVATKGGGWKEENTGGARVFVKNGVILKGPKNLSGRKLSDLDKDIPQDKREKIAKSQGEKNKAFIEAFKKKMEKEGTLADGAKKQPKKPAQEPEKTQNDKRLEALANRKEEPSGPKKDLMQEAMEHLQMMKKLDQEKKAKESVKDNGSSSVKSEKFGHQAGTRGHIAKKAMSQAINMMENAGVIDFDLTWDLGWALKNSDNIEGFEKEALSRGLNKDVVDSIVKIGSENMAGNIDPLAEKASKLESLKDQLQSSKGPYMNKAKNNALRSDISKLESEIYDGEKKAIKKLKHENNQSKMAQSGAASVGSNLVIAGKSFKVKATTPDGGLALIKDGKKWSLNHVGSTQSIKTFKTKGEATKMIDALSELDDIDWTAKGSDLNKHSEKIKPILMGQPRPLKSVSTSEGYSKAFDSMKKGQRVKVAMSTVMGSGPMATGKDVEYEVGSRSKNKFGIEKIRLYPIGKDGNAFKKGFPITIQRRNGKVSAVQGDMAADLKGISYREDGGIVQYKDEPKKDGWVTIRGRKVLIKNGEMVNPPEWMDGGKSKPSGDSGKEPEVKAELGKGKKVTTPEERELERARKEYDRNIETKRALKEAQKDLQAADAKKRRKGEAGANIRASKAKKSKIKRMMEAFKKDRKKANESTFMKELRNTFEQLKKSNFFRDATLKYGDGDAIFYEGRWITIGARKSKEERKAGEGGGESRGRRRRREGSDSPKNDGIPSGGARVFIKGGKKNAVIEKGPDGLEGKKIKDLDGGLSEKAKDEKAKKNLEKAKSKKNAYFGKKKGKKDEKDGLSEKGKSDMDKLNAIELDFSPPKIKAALDDDDSPKAPKNIDAAVQGLMDALDSAGHLDKGIDKAKDKVKGMKGLDQKIKYGVLKKLDELAGKKKGDGKKSLNAHQKAVVDHALASKGHIYDKEALDNVEVMLENFGVPEDVINDTISEIKEASDKAKKDGKDYGKDFDRAAYVKKVEEWENSLTDDHKRHISDFTGIGYDSIRAYQRGDHLKMSASEFRMKYNYSVEYAKEAAESIENALSTGPKMEVMTYRGLNDLPSDVYDKIMGQKSMEFNAMASSSFTYSVAQEFRDDGSSLKDSLMFEIENKSGVSIKGLSDMPWEDEVLIPQGTKYEIISTEETTRPSGARVGKIRLREISK